MQGLEFSQTKTAKLVLLSLLLAILGAIIAGLILPTLKIIPFIGVCSTLAIALLTVAYVIVTSGQLSVMQKQLEEMAKTRELEAQPLPLIEINKVFLAKPRFFYTPPDDEYSANLRLVVEYKIVNHGSHPSINIIAAAIASHESNKKRRVLEGGARQISVLGPGETYPTSEDKYDAFSFVGEECDEIIGVLRDRKYRNPLQISIRLIHKNILGACFANTWLFELAPKDEKNFSILTNWHSRLTSFDVDYSDEIQSLKKLLKKDEDKWEELFESVKDQFAQSLEGEDKLKLAWIETPVSFSTEIISTKQYESEIQERNFGRPIPKWMSCCSAVDEENDV